MDLLRSHPVFYPAIFRGSKYFQRDGTVELVREFNTGTLFYSNFVILFFKSAGHSSRAV
jgi:hypothetical protein